MNKWHCKVLFCFLCIIKRRNKQVSEEYCVGLITLNEKTDELLEAMEYSDLNKSVSFYDALNCVLAKERKMILITGDKQLIEFANKTKLIALAQLD